jgi:hypothetical protein
LEVSVAVALAKLVALALMVAGGLALRIVDVSAIRGALRGRLGT